MIRREGVAVAHFQNTFPIISPAAYYAAKGEGAPVVQSLRNYRLLCLNAQLYREGRVCTDCLARAGRQQRLFIPIYHHVQMVVQPQRGHRRVPAVLIGCSVTSEFVT